MEDRSLRCSRRKFLASHPGHRMESHYRRGNRIETPGLEVRYAAAPDSGFLRGSSADA